MILFDDEPTLSPPGRLSPAEAEAKGLTAYSSMPSSRPSAADFAAFESDLVGRLNFLNRFPQQFSRDGLSFGGARDLYTALGYATTLTPQDYWARYQRGGIASTLVELFPKMAWAGDFQVIEDEDPAVITPSEAAFSDLNTRLSLPSTLMRADIMAGLGHYAVLLVGTQLRQGQDLNTPLEPVTGPGDLLYLKPLDEASARIIAIEESAASPRFGQPTAYQATLGSPLGATYDYASGIRPGGISKTLHHTRVLHIAKGCLRDSVYGKPDLRAVWNYLDDLAKVVGGGAEAQWLRANPGLQFDLDREFAQALGGADSPAVKALRDKISEYIHGARRDLQTVGTTINAIGGTAASQVANFGPNATAILQLIAGTLRVPYRILIGSERAHLASTQDDENLRDRVKEYRLEHAVPVIRGLNAMLVFARVLPPFASDSYDVVWPEIEELTEDAKAKATLALAQANAAQAQAGGRPILTSDEIRADVWGKDPLDPEQEAAAGAGGGAAGASTNGGDNAGGPDAASAEGDLASFAGRASLAALAADSRISRGGRINTLAALGDRRLSLGQRKRIANLYVAKVTRLDHETRRVRAARRVAGDKA